MPGWENTVSKKTTSNFRIFHETSLGRIIHGDSVDVLAACADDSVDLIMTSPPFGLVRKKDYGNVDGDEYVDWFRPFAAAFHRVMKGDARSSPAGASSRQGELDYR